MTVGELRALLADLPDDAQINFADPWYGGRGRDLDEFCIAIEDGAALIDLPFGIPCD